MDAAIEVQATQRFRAWYLTLLDLRGRHHIDARLERLRNGHFGLRRVLGNGVWELKIHTGPGYRIYYRQTGRKVVLLLLGGDKGSQRHDIAAALRMARELEDTDGA